MQLLIVMFFALIGGLVLQTALTHAAAKLVQAENATWRRALVVVLMLTTWAVCCARVVHFLGGIESKSAVGTLVRSLTMLGLTAGGMLFIYNRMYRTTGRQLIGFIALQFVMLGVTTGYAFLLKRYVADAYVIPTNAMAPTIYGRHLTTVCPKCGGRAIHSFIEPIPEIAAQGAKSKPDADGICSGCWQFLVGQKIDQKAEPIAGDRIMVDKRSGFERWDPVVFYAPTKENVLYVKRVVGLPGEEIIIGDDGVLLIDGNRTEPPAHLPKLRYSARPGETDKEFPKFYDHDPILGDKRKPMKLGPDEYFMLGDNTHRSYDGRFWGPVKRDAIVAPVSFIYWPFDRIRIFE